MLIFRKVYSITPTIEWRGVAALYENDKDIVFYFSCCTNRTCRFPHLTCNQCPLEAVHELMKILKTNSHD